MRSWYLAGRPRRSVWVVVGIGATLAAVVALALTVSSTGHDAPSAPITDHPRPRAAAASTHVSGPPSSQQRLASPSIPALPSTENPTAYAAAVASRLLDVNPVEVSRADFIRSWRANLPTVVYSDAASKGLTLPVQNADAIDNLTHGWIPSQATWNAEASDATVSQLRITSVSVPAYWIDAVASGEFTDPGLHMERVTGVLTQTYGVGQRYSTRRPIVIDLGLLCGPTQPGGCRLLSPQQPPGQTTNS